jgi:hypothetical protein
MIARAIPCCVNLRIVRLPEWLSKPTIILGQSTRPWGDRYYACRLISSMGRCWLQSMEGSLPPPLLQNRACRRVGSQRVTRITEHFSNNPPPNELMSLSISSRSPVTTDDDQVCVGVPHLAYLTVADHQITCSPSPALPPPGSPGRWLASQRHTLPSVCVMPLQPSPLGTTRTPDP